MKRKPKEDELAEEVVREYRRQEQLKRSAIVNRGQDVNDLGSRVTNMEGSMSRLQEKVVMSQERLQGMLQQLLNKQTGHASVDDDDMGTGTLCSKVPTEPALLVQTASATGVITDGASLPLTDDDAADAPVSMEVDVQGDGADDVELPLADPDDMLGVLVDDAADNVDAVHSSGRLRSVIISGGPQQMQTLSREGGTSEGLPSADVYATSSRTEQICRVIEVQLYILSTYVSYTMIFHTAGPNFYRVSAAHISGEAKRCIFSGHWHMCYSS